MNRYAATPPPEPPTISAQLAQVVHLLNVVWRARWWGIATLVVCVGIGLAASYILPNEYRSTTMILVERQKVPEAYVRATVSDSMQERLKTISQQILSRSRIRQVIEEYDLVRDPTTAELVLERLHLADNTLLVGWGVGLGLIPDPKKVRSANSLVTRFKKSVKINVVGRQGFSVAYRGHDPLTVMRVTNALAGMFISENLKLRESRAEGTTRFLSSQLEQARQELEERERGVQALKKRFMGALPDQLDANLRALDRLQLQLQHIDETLNQLSEQKGFVQKQLIGAERQLAEMSEEARTALRAQDPLARQLAALEAKLARLRTQYTDRFPEVAQVKAQIDEIRFRMDSMGVREIKNQELEKVPVIADLNVRLVEISQEVDNLRQRKAKLTAEYASYKARVEQAPEVEQELQKLQRDYTIMQANYQALLQKEMNARLAESLERRQKGEQFRVLDPANLPTTPISPDRNMILAFSTVLGLLLGAGGAIGLDLLRPRFHSGQDITTGLGIPVLAEIPYLKELGRGT